MNRQLLPWSIPLLMALLGGLLPVPLSAQEAPPARVVTAEVREAEVSPTSRMVGVLRFIRVSEVAAEVEGLITAHHFDTGVVMKQGEVLAELGTDFISQDMNITRSQIDEVDAEIQQVALEVKRLKTLKSSSIASQSAYDEAFYKHRSLLSRRNTLQQRVRRLQLEIDKSQVRAPFDGLVLEKKRELGDWLERGSALARLASTEGVQAIIPVDERLVTYQAKGSEFEVVIPALNMTRKATFVGWVPFVEARSKLVYMKLSMPYESGMMENQSVEIQLPTETPRKLRMIPRAALLQRQGPPGVYTVKDGKAASVSVNIVARIGDEIGVDNDDIQPGMPVVVDGNDRLQPGQAVQVINE